MQMPQQDDKGHMPSSQMRGGNMLALAVFLLVAVGGGLAIGAVTLPGEWYAGLVKPWFNPPNWIFGPVWSVLYVFIAIAGWRTWQRERFGPAMKAWVAQMLANFAWSPVFFSAQRTGLALAVILLVLVFVLVFIRLTWPRDRVAAMLFLPYAAWVAFATALNGAIFWLN